jgi:hypothetical protein
MPVFACTRVVVHIENVAAPIHSQRRMKRGRPSKFTPALAHSIAECVGKGMRLHEAASRHRIPYPTVEQSAKDFVFFNDEIAYAQALWLERLLDKLYAGDNRDAAWLLERLHQTRFADPRVGVQLNIQNNMTVVPGLGMNAEELRAERERLDKLQAVPGKPAQLNRI